MHGQSTAPVLVDTDVMGGLTFPVRVSMPVTSLTFDPTRASPNEYGKACSNRWSAVTGSCCNRGVGPD